jgi:hypothetical protein
VARRAAFRGPRERDDRERVLPGGGDSEMRRGSFRRGSRTPTGERTGCDKGSCSMLNLEPLVKRLVGTCFVPFAASRLPSYVG